MREQTAGIPYIVIIFLSICLIASLSQTLQIKQLSDQTIKTRENVAMLKNELCATGNRIITETRLNNADICYSDCDDYFNYT